MGIIFKGRDDLTIFLHLNKSYFNIYYLEYKYNWEGTYNLKMERKIKNFIRSILYVNREENQGNPKNLLPSDDYSLNNHLILKECQKVKKRKKIITIPYG